MKIYGGRSMLNLPGFESTAAIVAELVEGMYGWEADIKISDCSRQITLSICNPAAADTDDLRFENDLYKVDTLIDTLKAFRTGMLRVRRMRRA